MARYKAEVLARSLEIILAERNTSAAREKKLVGALNGLLAKMGYQVGELGGGAPGRKARRRRGRAGGRRARRKGRRAVAKRGRKPGKPAKAQRKGRGRPVKGRQAA